ncbi:MAG: DUF3098 domain-containing protein [Candidatus Kapabacteria bacterium]|nr:DUF3098 domain-containing protein [Candidatus Kapabacteria bacterium]
MSKEIKSSANKSATASKQANYGRKPAKQAAKTLKWVFPLEKNNMIVLLIGFVTILIGYGLMATGITTNEPSVVDGKWNNFFAITLAPIVLIIGYVVIIPYGIMKVFKKKDVNPIS